MHAPSLDLQPNKIHLTLMPQYFDFWCLLAFCFPLFLIHNVFNYSYELLILVAYATDPLLAIYQLEIKS